MLALRAAGGDDLHRRDPQEAAFDICSGDDDGFPDFSDANALLDGIDFDDLFVGMDDDGGGDVLPELELLADVSSIAAGEEDKGSGSGSGSDEGSGGEEVASKRAHRAMDSKGSGENGNDNNSSPKNQDQEKSRKSSSSKNSHGKRKVKVDWTPELHRRFVQAVEQLGVDKAVPSRILELMGIDCLTRHNIASHLQKYRSHRKHLLAREAEAASWTQRRQMYGCAGGKRPDPNRWLAQPPARPTMGFPPMATPPPMHHFRPLHVWGHPSADQSAVHTWQKHMSPPPWAPSEQPFWHHHQQRVRGALTPGTPCFPQALPPPPPMRFGAPPVQGIPPQAYKVGHGIAGAGGPGPPPALIDDQPSKESIDAAIGDVLSKPWLPLPLGLKPPSTDSVMVELHRHGVPKIPPATTCA